MTSPVSAVEAIEKAMREAAVNLVDTLVLERETNGQSKEFSDWAVFMVMGAFKVQRADAASQAEALKRENAELREGLKPFADAAQLYDPPEGDDGDVAWEHDFTIGSLRRARTLLKEEANAE